jgi:hypothetical protein
MKIINAGAPRLSMFRLLLAAIIFLLPVLAGAQQSGGSEQGAIIRIGGNAFLGADEAADAVIVIDGNATIAGRARSVFVIDGIVTLDGGEVDELTVIDGRVDARDGSIIAGDVTLIDAELDRAPGAMVRGNIHRDSSYRIGEGFRIFGLVMGIGYAIALIAGGLLVAAIASEQARRIGTVIAKEPGPSLLAALLAWILIPTAAIIIMFSVVGIPLGIALLFFLFPALGFVGYLATGIRFGDYLIEKIRGAEEEGRPYMAALLGIGILVLVGWVPVLGSILSFLASFIGSGAIVLTAWRSMRSRGRPAAVVPAEEIHRFEEVG